MKSSVNKDTWLKIEILIQIFFSAFNHRRRHRSYITSRRMMPSIHRKSIGLGTIIDTIAERSRRQDEDGGGGAGGAADDLFQIGELFESIFTCIKFIWTLDTKKELWLRQVYLCWRWHRNPKLI